MNAVSRHSVWPVVALAVAAAAIGLLGLIVCPGSAYASPQLDTAKSPQVVVYYPKCENNENYIVLNAPEDEEDLEVNLTKCVSSNKDVLDCTNVYSTAIALEVKKAGTATLTCVYKDKKYKIKYVVKKYVNPVKTLKIGKKNYAKKFKTKNFYTNYSAPLGGKLKVVPAKNWKIKQLRLSYLNEEDGYCEKNVKNGKKIYGIALVLTLKNTKTKAVERIIVDADDGTD